ncbi:MAG: hypothetical protein FJ104_08235 [Deltaproteobacteria bacterium]|nr:hypothetical protein [Deltaproteobacteria bacterium]
MSRAWVTLGALAALGALALGCEGPEPGSRTFEAPAPAGFSLVSAVLEPRCGTLDCHGAPERSLRVHGAYGARLDGNDQPGGRGTTSAEIRATWESVVAVDPEGLARPDRLDRWLVLSKGTAREAHEGGPALPPGSDAERCVRSFAEGQIDEAACAGDSYTALPRPGETW